MPDPLAQDDVLSFDPRSPFLTAPDAGDPAPVVASRAAADLQPRIEEAGRHSQAAVEAAERSMAQEDRNAAARERELAPLRERQMEMARQPIPEPPKTKESPPAPQRQNQHDDENWLFAAGLLGSLAGALTRNHATNALAAFSGALQGYQEGSREKFDQNMKIWEAENKRAQEASQNALAEYRAILENRKLSMEQMSVELQLAAAKHDDRAMQTAAKTKNELVIAQLYDKHEQALTQVQTTHDRLSQSYELAQQRQQQQMAIAQMRALGVKPGEENALIQCIGEYRCRPITGARGAAIMNLVTEHFPDYDVKVGLDKFARATIGASEERAGKTAAARTFNTAGANTEIVMSRAGPVLTNAAEAANAVPATEFKRINQLYQAAAEEISDPAVRNFKVANEELAALFAAVMNPRSNVITVSAMEHARDQISAADGPDAYYSVLKNIQRLAERESENIRRLRAGGQAAPIEIPPINPNRSSTVGGMVGGAVDRTTQGINKAAPTAEQSWKDMHKLPDWMPRVPESVPWNQQKKPPPSSGADMPIMLPPGWNHEVEP
jgi:hypothetical protein